jgi:hypothetical protein
MKHILQQVAALLLFASALLAQQAEISGFVKDPSGEVIPKASVVIQNIETNVQSATTSNGAGVYTLPLLPPGNYRLTVEAPGFEKQVVEGIRLDVGAKLSRTVTLALGTTGELVTVNSDALNINTTDASVSTVIDRQFVDNIPLNGRSFQSLLTLAPGVSLVPAQGGAYSTSGSSVGYGGEVSVNGQRTESNYFTVDGVSANTGTSPTYNLGNGAGVSGSTPGESVLGTTQSMVSIDALQEFRAITSTYSAEYGRTPGGQFSFSTRSGTNDWHGSLFDYLRNDALDANNWFNNQAGLPRSAERQNDFGGTLAGPLSIPGLYDGKNKTFFFLSYEGLRLSAPQAAITTNVPSLEMRSTAPAALQPVLNAFPLPSANGRDLGNGLSEFISGYSNPSSLNSTSIRVDHVFSDRFRIFGRYGHSPSNADLRYTSDLAVITSDTQRYDTGTFGATNVINPVLNNEFRLNLTRNDFSLSPRVDNFGGATPFSITSLPGLVDQSQLWFFLYYSLNPELQLAPQATTQRQLNINDTFSATLGRHTWKWGADYRRINNWQSIPIVQESGLFLDQSQVLLNQPSSVNLWTFSMPVNPVYENFSAFAQDEWKVNSRLNLSLGLRWELNPAPHDALGNNPYTVTTTDLATMQVAPKNTPLWATTYRNFAPRIGLAYRANQSAEHTTVIRIGSGLFYDTGNTTGSLGYNGLGQGGISYMSGIPFPATPAQIAAVSPATAAPPYNNFVLGYDPHLKLPYSVQWSAAVEQSLGSNQALSFSYVGSLGRRFLRTQNFDPSLVGNTAFSEGYGITLTSNGVTSNYNALQVQFQRRLSRGLQALASYTWSHALDDATSNFEVYQLEHGSSDYDVRHSLQAALTYDIPGSYGSRILRALFRNWSADFHFSARSSLPVDITGTQEYSAINGQFLAFHPDVVSGQPLYISDSNAPGGRLINFNAFQPVTDADGNPVEGNLGRNALRGFSAIQADLAIRRQFTLSERVHLQFRAESFNIANTPIFGSIYNQLSNGQEYFGRSSNTLNNQLGGLSALYQTGGPRSLQLALKLQF